MAIAIRFDHGSMTRAQYDEVLARVEAAGQGSPAGRVYHCAFGRDDDLHVFDVWDSMESFEAFGATLMPILGELGADAGEPSISEVQNTIVG